MQIPKTIPLVSNGRIATLQPIMAISHLICCKANRMDPGSWSVGYMLGGAGHHIPPKNKRRLYGEALWRNIQMRITALLTRSGLQNRHSETSAIAADSVHSTGDRKQRHWLEREPDIASTRFAPPGHHQRHNVTLCL